MRSWTVAAEAFLAASQYLEHERIRRPSLWECSPREPFNRQRTPAEIAFDAIRCEHFMYGLYRCRGLRVRDGLCATCLVLGIRTPAPHSELR